MGGDINRRDFSTVTNAFPDIVQSDTGPTTDMAKLDLIATIVEHLRVKWEIFLPLEMDYGWKSDHSIVFSKYFLPNMCMVGWRKYRPRERTDKAAKFDREMDQLMDECFPLRNFSHC